MYECMRYRHDLPSATTQRADLDLEHSTLQLRMTQRSLLVMGHMGNHCTQ